VEELGHVRQRCQQRDGRDASHALYGTTSEQLGWVAVNGRRNASMNPDAVMRTPITIEDHQSSRWIVEPLHLFDCCLITDGE